MCGMRFRLQREIVMVGGAALDSPFAQHMRLERLHHCSTLKRFAYRSNFAEVTDAVPPDKHR